MSTSEKEMPKVVYLSDMLRYKRDLMKQKTIGQITRWNYQSVESAINAQVTGDFSRTTQLSRAMQAEPAYNGALEKRVQSFIRSDFNVNADNDSEIAEAFSKFIEDNFFYMLPEIDLQDLIKSYLQLGVALAFVEWNFKDSFLIPKVHIMDTEFLKYSQFDQTWTYQTANGVETIDPKSPNWLFIKSWKPGKVTGFVSTLGSTWVTKKFTEKDYLEANSNQTEKVTIIKETPNEGYLPQQNDVNNLVSEIQTQKKDRVMYLPKGYEAEFNDIISSYDSNAFSNLLEYCDRKIQVAILGNNTSSEIVDQGSRATAEVHNAVERAFTEADIQIFSTELREQLIKHIISVNFKTDENVPWVMWSAPDEYDFSELKTVDELLKSNGLRISNLEDIVGKYGIKTEKLQ
jgi:phage gp29-like protein